MFGMSFIEQMKYEILVTPIDILDMPREKNNNKYKKKTQVSKIK